MNRTYLTIVIIAIIVTGGAVVAILLQAGASESRTISNIGHSDSMNMNEAPAPSAVSTNSVDIQNYVFSPSNITVKQGTTVTWDNKDSVVHTVTESDGKTGPSSDGLNPSKSYTFTFITPGTYHYHCLIHTEMAGTVTVTAS